MRVRGFCRSILALPVLVFATFSAVPADTPLSDDALLNALQGRWDMQGTVMGRAVRYRADGRRVLQGGFVRLHLIDAALIGLAAK